MIPILFSRKLDTLMYECRLSNSMLARASGLDASLISRFRTGARVPTQYSAQLDKLAKGIVISVDEEDVQRNLYNSFDTVGGDEKALSRAIYDWFCSEDSELKPQRGMAGTVGAARKRIGRKRRVGLRSFSEKLDAIMNALDMKNVRLARNLNVDASLISRFRTGVRRPTGESQMIDAMCGYFLSVSHEPKQRTTLCELIGLPLVEEDGKLRAALQKWLTETDEPEHETGVDALLVQLERQSRPDERNYSARTEVADPVNGVEPGYIGTAGMRKAAARFLAEASRMDEPCRICWYSDLPVDWIIEDEAFLNTWKEGLSWLLGNGFTLDIIVDVELAGKTFLGSFGEWMPLTFSGSMNVYVPSGSAGNRFSKNLLIADESMAVTCDCACDMLPLATTYFVDTREHAAYLARQFDALMRTSAPLMQVYANKEAEACLAAFSDFSLFCADMLSVGAALPLSTLPVELLRTMLLREGIPDAEAERLCVYLHDYKAQLMANLEHKSITECCALPTDTELAAGRVALWIIPFLVNRPIYYTPGDFAEHCRATIETLISEKNFSINTLPQTPFSNVSIYTKRGFGMLCTRTAAPQTVIRLKHDAMTRTLIDYISEIMPTGERITGAKENFSALSRFIDV